MRRLAWLAIVLVSVGGIGVEAQAPPIVTPSQSIYFDYLDTDLVYYQVSRFEYSTDGGAWAPLGPLSGIHLADTPYGYTSYQWVQPFTSGAHSVAFRACSYSGCGGATPTFSFRGRRR